MKQESVLKVSHVYTTGVINTFDGVCYPPPPTHTHAKCLLWYTSRGASVFQLKVSRTQKCFPPQTPQAHTPEQYCAQNKRMIWALWKSSFALSTRDSSSLVGGGGVLVKGELNPGLSDWRQVLLRTVTRTHCTAPLSGFDVNLGCNFPLE